MQQSPGTTYGTSPGFQTLENDVEERGRLEDELDVRRAREDEELLRTIFEKKTKPHPQDPAAFHGQRTTTVVEEVDECGSDGDVTPPSAAPQRRGSARLYTPQGGRLQHQHGRGRRPGIGEEDDVDDEDGGGEGYGAGVGGGAEDWGYGGEGYGGGGPTSAPLGGGRRRRRGAGGMYGGGYHHDSSPMLQSQLMQMQNQMSMLSQAMVQSQFSQSKQLQEQQQMRGAADGGGSARDSMLCFTLGERLGALNKNDEVTKDGLATVSTELGATRKELGEIRTRHQVLESRCGERDRQHARLMEVHRAVSQDLSETRRDLALLQHDSAASKERAQEDAKRLRRELEQLEQRVGQTAEQAGQQALTLADVVNDQKHRDRQDKEQRKALAKVEQNVGGLASRVDGVEVHLLRDRQQLQQETKQMQRKVAALEESQREALQQLCQRLELMQRDFMLLKADVSGCQASCVAMQSSVMAVGGQMGPIGGVTSFCMQLVLPFLSNSDRAQQLVGWLSGLGQVRVAGNAKKVWMVVGLVDAGMRALEIYCPWVGGAAARRLRLQRHDDCRPEAAAPGVRSGPHLPAPGVVRGLRQGRPPRRQRAPQPVAAPVGRHPAPLRPRRHPGGRHLRRLHRPRLRPARPLARRAPEPPLPPVAGAQRPQRHPPLHLHLPKHHEQRLIA